jgi:nitroreductase
MDVMDAIRQRYSVRKYTSEAVGRDALERIMEAARLAPSASNVQEWRFVLVTDPAKRRALREAAQGQRFVEQAPVVIVACAETDEREMACGQYAYSIDVAIALEHIALQAVEEGLGTCWIGAFNEEMAREVIGAPPSIRVVQLMTLGHPQGEAGPKNRKDLSEIVMAENWGSDWD